MPPDFLSTVLDSALSLGITIFALWVISKRLWKSQEDHMESYKDRIVALEKHSEACDRDRADLHTKHSELQANVIDKLTQLANQG